MKKLTDIQESVFEFIKEHLMNNHSTPTNKEITKAMGWNSANTAYGHVQALGKKGYLELYDDGSGKYRLSNIDLKLEKVV